jgi:hypothetical protein
MIISTFACVQVYASPCANPAGVERRSLPFQASLPRKRPLFKLACQCRQLGSTLVRPHAAGSSRGTWRLSHKPRLARPVVARGVRQPRQNQHELDVAPFYFRPPFQSSSEQPFHRQQTAMAVSPSGFALRLNGSSCLDEEVNCGTTVAPYRVCCPAGAFCPSQYNVNVSCCIF